jgi:outer membrane receptor protein involved in Fe transport
MKAVVQLALVVCAAVTSWSAADARAADAGADLGPPPDGGHEDGDGGGLDAADGGVDGLAEDVTPAPIAQPVSRPPPAASPPGPIDVTVRGRQSAAQRLQESAEAVTVVDTRKAKQQTADLGEVLARTQGVGVRREGGLGSNAVITLNGLQADQIRLFLDGVPLNLSGYPFGLVNVPVNLVDRLEVYRGVVPLRFGADALGGAINVVSNQNEATNLALSYQTGSFGTHRVSASGRYRHPSGGLFTGGSAYFDTTRNDFMMNDRELPTPEGGTIVKSVRRFHDGYRAFGGNAEAGVVNRPWARRLSIQGFGSTYDKDLQHNADMSLPFGAITYGETVYGATARYEASLRQNLEVEALANYAHRVLFFRDLSPFTYTWEGQLGQEPVGRNGARGELLAGAIDTRIYEDGGFGRLMLTWTAARGHRVRAGVTSSAVTRIGDDRVEDRPDLLHLREGVAQAVGGLEYDVELFEDRLENVAFGKAYVFSATAQERAPVTADIFERHRDIQRLGGGDGLRFRFTPWLLGKASYEYATRLPNVVELFGDGVLIEPSKNDSGLLRPEVSHNFNLGPRLELKMTRVGDVTLDVNGFVRLAQDMIILLQGKQFIPYANLSDARIRGIEGALSWAWPARGLRLDGTFTRQESINASTSGAFAGFNGMRIPGRPYMFASWGGRARVPWLTDARSPIEAYYHGRYVHGFNRAWDVGNPDVKWSVPWQLSHAVGVTWIVPREVGTFTMTFEIDNLTNALLFDVYGVQRPGRAGYLKVTAQL